MRRLAIGLLIGLAGLSMLGGSAVAQPDDDDVPGVTGEPADDATDRPAASELTAGDVLARFTGRTGIDDSRTRELYADDFAVSDRLGTTRLFGDLRYLLAARHLARSMAKAESPAYLYYFTFVPPHLRDEWAGAPHGSELPPLFGRPLLEDEIGEVPHRVGLEMRRRFVSFAENGSPDVSGLPAWPSYNPVEDPWLVIDEQQEIRQGVLRDKLDYFETLYDERTAGRHTSGP